MSVTVHGCVSWPSGEITFTDLETCLEQESCVYFTGEHAGQVALTLSGATNNEDCNDTFYGCVNWSTGKFQVEIPEDCCLMGEDCAYCDPGTTPLNIVLRLENFTQLTGCLITCGVTQSFRLIDTIPINGDYILTQNGPGCYGNCCWSLDKAIDADFNRWDSSNCEACLPYCTQTADKWVNMRLLVNKLSATSISLSIRLSPNAVGGPIGDIVMNNGSVVIYSGLTIKDCMGIWTAIDDPDVLNQVCTCQIGSRCIATDGTIKIQEGTVFNPYV